MAKNSPYAAFGPIYDVVTASERWPAALDAVTIATGARVAAMFVSETASALQSPFNLTAVSPSYRSFAESRQAQRTLETYAHYAAADRRKMLESPVQSLVWDTDLAGTGDDGGSRPDHVYLRAAVGLGRMVGIRLNADSAWFDMLWLGYHHGDETATAQARRSLPILAPHLAKAVQTGRTFAALRARYQAVLSVLDRVQVGLAIALESGELILRNAEADRILGLDDGVTLDAGNRLIGRDPDLAAQALAAIREASLTADGLADRPEMLMTAARPSGLHPFLVEMTPIAESDGGFGHALRGALITLIDPTNEPSIDVSRFALVYGLTGAESEVCRLMLRGLTGPAIAAMRSTSPETIKSQTSAVLSKTGCRSRADLARLAVRIAPPID